MKKILLIIAFILPMTVMAQEKKDTTAQISQTDQTLQLAAELSKYGYANNDALSLIQAARLSKQAGLTEAAADKKESGKKDAALASSGKSGQVSLDPSKLLADAKAKAGNDDVLLALIDDVSKTQTRGAVGGARYNVSNVNANDYDLYNLQFRAGQTATVIVIGDGDTDLDLYVYDANGNLIDSDTDYSDNCICTWVPRWTGTFTIKIVNRGSVYNHYVLRTN